MKRVLWYVLIIFLIGTSTGYAVPYRGYLFDFWSETVPAPQAYVPAAVLTGSELQVGRLNSPQDIFVTEGEIYLLDSGNNRILIFDHNWTLMQEIREFVNDQNERDTFNSPRGLFVTDAGHIYVADRNNQRVVELDKTGAFIRAIGEPQTDVEGVIPEGFRYQPRKVVVDIAERMYVISEGTFDGILEFDPEGNFRGFIGAPRIKPNLIDYFWSRVATKEQRKRRALFLPTEYSNMHIDESGFIFATVSGLSTDETDAVRRLNPSGKDVLRRQGFYPPTGDIQYPYSGLGATIEGRSVFVDVVTRENGLYSTLDIRRSRVFTYDSNGSLLYVFGGTGDQVGLIQGPVAIEALGDQIIVLDGQLNRLTIFEPTLYAQYIHSAIHYHQIGEYDLAAEMWTQALKFNANLDQAYSGIGRSLLRQDQFAEAMENFRLGNNRKDYSKALALHRREVISDNFSRIMTVFVVAVFALYLLIKFKPYARITAKLSGYYGWHADSRSQSAFAEDDDLPRWRRRIRRTIRSLWFSVYTAFHPFDGFWDLKHEKRGDAGAATIILILVVLTNAFGRQYTGFPMNTSDPTKLNILMEIASVAVPFFLWVTVNWSLTTLLEGKGTFRDIYIATAFALTPLVLVNIPMTIFSNYITLEEAAFYYVITGFAGLWTLGLIFIGNMTIHEFFTTKTIWSSALTIAGMFLVAFIGLLFFSLIGEMVNFVTSVYTEVTFRL
ncbi:MAG: hypothetical protein GX331_08630 [Firmicutes bacterium]|nr:hypothetical protein [Bacillota bacterium]